MSTALLLLQLAAAGTSPQLVVDAGVYPVPGAEIFVGRFSIDGQATPWTKEGFFGVEGCDLATPDEWLAASTQPQFEVGPFYEHVQEPWTEECQMSRADQEAVVEAEGVIFETQYYIAGVIPADAGVGAAQDRKAPKPLGAGFKRVVAGQAQDRAFGDPSPQAYRCVRRASVASKKRFVAASGINLRTGRGPEFPISDGADIGRPVDELFASGDWSYVTVALRRNDCDYRAQGWVKTDFLSDVRPDRNALLAAGKIQLQTHQFALAATELERAYAFDKADVVTRGLLLEAYDRAGMKAEADKVRHEAKKITRRKRRK